ncbi:polyhomeotic-like protein 2 isoform X3 [Chroicocephalus ridibundus]|uniref:polyhomeotic-like protein 2 isoform X3 n=1 Tax=Chroicocephalus ridibundus TaxID=1192867 RepID=UPI002FDE7E01
MTSGTGSSASTVAGAAPHNGENKPPQAIVKPQILTHVIEGFVIQEGAEPFPYAQELLAEKLPPQDNTTTTDSEMEEPYLQGVPPRPPESKEEGNPPKLKCELCGRVDFAYKFKRSKRFCSMACAKRYNVGCTKRVGLFHPDRSKLQKPGGPPHGRRRTCKGTLPTLGKDTKKQPPVSLPPGSVPLSVTASLQLNHSQEDSSRCSDNSSYEEPLSPISASSSTSRRRQGERDLELREMDLPDVHVRDLAGIGHRFLPSEPSKWNVEDVYEFIRSLPGCQEIAEEFRAQEIDGQALLLLKEDHLMSTMNIKLGPALKIYARISMLKDS